MVEKKKDNHWMLQYLTLDIQLNIIACVFGILALKQIFGKITLYRERSLDHSLDVGVLSSCIPAIALIIIVLLFANKNKLGWTGLMAYLMFIIVDLFLVFQKLFRNSVFKKENELNSFYDNLDIPIPWENIPLFCLNLWIIWFLYSQDVKTEFIIGDALGKKILMSLVIFVMLVNGIMFLIYA